MRAARKPLTPPKFTLRLIWLATCALLVAAACGGDGQTEPRTPLGPYCSGDTTYDGKLYLGARVAGGVELGERIGEGLVPGCDNEHRGTGAPTDVDVYALVVAGSNGDIDVDPVRAIGSSESRDLAGVVRVIFLSSDSASSCPDPAGIVACLARISQ